MTDSNAPQTFMGRNTREAFARVRAVLGRDAVILEQHRQGGMVRVVAAADYPETEPHRSVGQPLAVRLAALGFETAFIDSLPRGLSSWAELEKVLLARIPLAAVEPTRGTFRFVGAPGVGKTTMIIKLMAEHVLHHGRAGCLLVSTDCHRLAGAEPLALAADLLGVEFREVAGDGLVQLLNERPNGSLVLVDTPGIHSRIPASASLPRCADVLVASAAWQPGALRKVARQLDLQSIQSVALTQIDQAETVGGCLGVIAGWARPLRWLSCGPELHDDLVAAEGRTLASLLHQGIDQPQMSTTFS